MLLDRHARLVWRRKHREQDMNKAAMNQEMQRLQTALAEAHATIRGQRSAWMELFRRNSDLTRELVRVEMAWPLRFWRWLRRRPSTMDALTAKWESEE